MILTRSASDLVDVVADLAGVLDRVDPAGLDHRTGHSPECVGETRQGTQHQYGWGQYFVMHGRLHSTISIDDIEERI